MKYMFVVCFFLVAFQAKAVDSHCQGPVAMAMADHDGCTDANGKRLMAFKLNSTSNPWMCARTELGSAMILSVAMAKRDISIWIDDEGQGKTCSTVTDYSKVSYMILYQ